MGANVGQTAWGLFVRYFPGATIYCFEPAAGPFGVLQCKYGSRRNVHCINAALGADAEKRTLLVGADTELNTFVARDGPRGGPLTDHEVVEVDTVDRLCAARDIAQIDVLKMDVQGWECAVLSGAARMVAERRVRFVVSEVGFSRLDAHMAGVFPTSIRSWKRAVVSFAGSTTMSAGARQSSSWVSPTRCIAFQPMSERATRRQERRSPRP